MLPHHQQSNSSEITKMVFPHRRLSASWGWNLPIPEVLLIIGGLILQQIYPDPRSSGPIDGELLVIFSSMGLVAGIPLVFVPLRVFWFDMAYIIIGLAVALYMRFYVDGPIIFLGLVAFLAVGMVITGMSHLMRRLLAFLLARRRQRAVISATHRDQDL